MDKEDATITVKRQCELLGINRTSVYRKPVIKFLDDEELRIRGWIGRIHIDEITTPRELRATINSYMFHYNHCRPHTSIDNETPAKVYYGSMLTQVS